MNLNQNLNETLAGLPVPAPALNEESIAVILDTEDEHLPEIEYLERLRNGELDLKARMDALKWIIEVHVYFNFSPDCAYLAINYMDRFLSVYDLPKNTAIWAMQLLALACVSIAAKMEEIEVPLSIDLQVGDCKYIFEGKTIQKMELLVLSTLKWRMLAITPFKLLRCFLKKVTLDEDDDNDENDKGVPIIFSKSRSSTQLILNMITEGIELMEFKPSEIAAAMAMSIAWETKSLPVEQSISLFTHHFHKERVMECFDLINGSSSSSSSNLHDDIHPPLMPSLPQSPIGVLDASTLLSNFKMSSDDESSKVNKLVVGSFVEINVSQISPFKKRRKLNGNFEFDQVVEP
ncbi:cyclin-D4-1-like [Impatiens glandulifera]|uniref:cyclin-D4-1-like n=1 Tax=Impatiens glandulifera TaxID=253017 RepID=UPI001FB07C43|nr:cyclin-D4-1-like [Impatiens glandulifera]